MLLKLFKSILGLLLLPACWAVSLAVHRLYESSIQIGTLQGVEDWALPIGFLLWVAVYFLLPRPFRTYVLGHELTHALWAVMMGARVGRIKVSAKGGHVELSKSNFLITLAPYFFPFYTVLVIAAYTLCGLRWEMTSYQAWWLGLIGFTWSFHLTFTLHMLAQRQPDIQEHGRLFSYVVIYLMNLMCIGLWMILIGPPTFAAFGHILWAELQPAYCTTTDHIGNWIALATEQITRTRN